MASSAHLKPGETGAITVKVNTAGRRGRLVKTVRVESNDPERPQIVLRLKAIVKKVVLVGPKRPSIINGNQ